nr:hypothetical protein [Tanacetum cinerariifolium]
MDSLSPQVVATAKLPILNPNEFDLWKMRIKQYFLMTNYSLGEVILNGDSLVPTRIVEGVSQPVAPTTAEQRLARKNEVKARGTLLMALPDKHQLKFNSHKDAKTLMEAIEKKFGLDQIHDRLQKLVSQLEIHGVSHSQEDVNLKFLRSLPFEWKTHTLIWRNNVDLEEHNLDDLFNSLKIYETEVKQSSSPGTATKNLAFVSSTSTDSTTDSFDNEDLKQIDVDDLEEIDLRWQMAMLTMLAKRFLQKTGINLSANGPTSMGFDMSKVECYKCHRKGHFARECRSSKDPRRPDTAKPQRRTVLVETSTSNALVSQCDGTGSYDWSYQAELKPANFVLMAFSSNSSFNNEVPSCSKACLKAYAQLHTQYDKLTDDFRKSQFDVISYQTGLESVEARLLVYKQNESLQRLCLIVKIIILQKVNVKVGHLVVSMIGSNKVLSPSKPEQDLSHTSRPSAPIIEDWVSDSEEDSETKDPQQFVPSFAQSSKHVKTPRHSVQPFETTFKAATSVPASLKSNSSGKRRNKKAYFYAPLIHSKPQKHRVPTVVLTQSKPVSNIGVKPVSAALPNITMTCLRHAHQVVTKSKSPIQRHITHNPSSRTRNSPPRVNVVQVPVELNRGYVAFRGHPKGGKITGKGKIETGKLDFDDVYFVKELKFNLFSVSQMCDKKNSVLFTDTECLVLSSAFKLPDESQVFLRVPRENNMNNVNLKNIVPSGDLTCLFSKATLDESNLWHRRLAHASYGLIWTNFVKSMNKKSYCLVITDDYSRFNWVFFLATKDETTLILKTFLTGLENQLSLKVKVLRSDNGTKFKNSVLNQFYGLKGIKREFSVPRTPQQNGIAERKNMTLIEATRTMLIDSLLPIPFCDKAVNTACYVQNRVLVTKPHNKTPYELSHGRSPSIGFMRPFGCHVTILNTLDPLGKFQGKVDEGFLVGYSVCIKAFRVFDSRTRIIQETLHVNFLENKSNVAGTGPTWLFDIDSLTRTMNYHPVTARNQTNFGAEDAAFDGKEHDFDVKKPESQVILSSSNSAQSKEQDDQTKKEAKGKSLVESVTGYRALNADTNTFSAAGPSNTAVSPTYGKTYDIDASQLPDDLDMPGLEEIIYSDDEDVFGAEADFNNLESSIPVSPIPTTRTHKDHHEEPKRVRQALKDPSWIEAIQEELLQFKMQKVWVLVDLHYGKRAIGTKWVYRNKKDERGILIRNKARLVAQGHTQEEGIDYEEVKQKKDGIFISQDKYVAEILRKFRLTEGKSASTPIDKEKPLLKDPDGEDVDVHTYRSMIGSLMYLTSSRPDIMFACKKQTVIAISSTEAEYVAAATCCAQVLWIQNQWLDYGYNFMHTCWLSYLTTNGSQFTMSNPHKNWLVQKQTALGKDKSNPLMADNLPKIMWYSTHHIPLMQIWLVQKQTALELASPKANGSWLQALVDKKTVVITEATIRDALCVDDVAGVDCLTNAEIFAELACRKFNFSKYIFKSLVRNVDSSTKFYMYPRFIQLIIQNQLGDLSTHTTKYTFPALTQKVFANIRRVGKGFLRVETPLFEGMLVARELEEQGDAEEKVQDDVDDAAAQGTDTAVQGNDVHKTSIPSPTPPTPPLQQSQDLPSTTQEALDACAALARRVEHLEYDKVAQALEITKLKRRVKQLERGNKVKVLKLRILKKVAGDDQVNGRQAKIYKIDMDHTSKVLSMQEDEPEVQEVVDVVTTAKLITKVVTAASESVTAASTTIAAAEPQVLAATIIVIPSKDKGKGIMVEEPKPLKKKQHVAMDEEYVRKLHEQLNKDIDWNVAIDHVKQKAKENSLDYFKGMSYDDIRPIFEAKFNLNIEFLLKSKEQLEEEENRAIQSINETPAQKAAKRRKLNEEAMMCIQRLLH